MKAELIDLFIYCSPSSSSSSVVMVIFSVVWIYFLRTDGEYQFSKWPRQIESHFFCK